MDGARLARRWRRLNANQFPPPLRGRVRPTGFPPPLWGRVRVGGQRNAPSDRLFPNLERSAHGSDAVLTVLHLAVHCGGESMHRESQLAALVREPDDRRCRRPTERLEAAEVHGRFDPRLEPPAPYLIHRLDGDTRFNLPDLRLKPRDQPPVRTQPRKTDPTHPPK